MKNVVLGSVFILSYLSIGGVAAACDMHGGGFGFGLQNANWATYNPRATTTDPSYGAEGDALMSPLEKAAVPLEKAKPSFSNAANVAAFKAKARLAKKTKTASVDVSSAPAATDVAVKKVSLDADR